MPENRIMPALGRTDSAADGPAPLDYLIAARACPRLAARIRLSTGLAHSDPWPHRFLAVPNWQTLAKVIRPVHAEDPAACERIQRVAHAARMLAALTGSADPETAYWSALTSGFRYDVVDDLARRVAARGGGEPVRRCVDVAYSLLAEDGRTIRPDQFAVAASLHPNWPWREWRCEIQRFRPAPAPTAEWLRLLQADARARGAAVEADIQRALRRMAEATYSLGALVDAAVADPVLGRRAVWCPARPHQSEADPGFGAAYPPLADGIDWPSRAAFERSLPPDYREGCSRGSLHFYYPASHRLARKQWEQCLEELVQPARWVTESEVARRTAEEALQTLRRSHEDRVREAVAELSAGAGHEINNPLATIRGKVRLLRAGETDENRLAALGQIDRQVERVTRMISDLHFLGRAIQPDEVTTPLATLLTDAAAAALGRCRPQTLSLPDTTGLPVVRGEAAMLTRLYAEILTNACQAAGPDGRVEVVADADGTVRVRDSGTGFGDEAWQHASTPFYSGRQAGRGLGMGLPVAMHIAAAHGGRIDRTRRLPTEVTVTLPCCTGPPIQARPDTAVT